MTKHCTINVWNGLKAALTLLCMTSASLQSAHASPVNVDEVRGYFKGAAERYLIPESLLESIGYVESRWQQVVPDSKQSHGAHTLRYGVMGLTDDNNNSLGKAPTLQKAAEFLQIKNSEDLIYSIKENVYGGAIILRSLRDDQMIKDGAITDFRLKAWQSDPMKWAYIVGQYYALRHPEATEGQVNMYIHNVYIILKEGYPAPGEKPADTITIAKVEGIQIDPTWSFHLSPANQIQPKAYESDVCSSIKIFQYPAITGDFDNDGSLQPKFIVIHDTQGAMSYRNGIHGTIDTLRGHDLNPNGSMRKASSHYLVTRKGEIFQLVDPAKGQVAYHAANYNHFGIGIEHEGFSEQTGWYTQAMYEASAKLSACLIHRFINKNHDLNFITTTDHVFPHQIWEMEQYINSPLRKLLQSNPRLNHQMQSHTDPGPHWRWDLYFDFLNGDKNAFEKVDPQDDSKVFRVFKLNPHPTYCTDRQKKAHNCPPA